MKRLFAVLTTSLVVLLGSQAFALGQYTSGSTGVDEGWPNCKTAAARVSFGIVGVSDGTGYTTSP